MSRITIHANLFPFFPSPEIWTGFEWPFPQPGFCQKNLSLNQFSSFSLSPTALWSSGNYCQVAAVRLEVWENDTNAWMPLHQLKSGNLSFNANKWCHTGSFAFANSTLTISNFTAEGESHKNFPSSKGNLLKYSGLSSVCTKGGMSHFFLTVKKI